VVKGLSNGAVPVEEKGSRTERHLRKTNRLVGETAFREVMSKGRCWESPELKVYILEGKEGPARLAIIIRKIFGGAVKRNRFKRRVREALRRHPVFADGIRVIAVAKKGALDLTYADIIDQLDRVFGGPGA
jgi:ribonuclease P protein component